MHPCSILLFYYSIQTSPSAILLGSTLPLMHEHLGLNLAHLPHCNLALQIYVPSPPQTRQQQAGPSHPPPPATAPPGATALGPSGPPPASSSSSHASPSSGITAATSSSVSISAHCPPPDKWSHSYPWCPNHSSASSWACHSLDQTKPTQGHQTRSPPSYHSSTPLVGSTRSFCKPGSDWQSKGCCSCCQRQQQEALASRNNAWF